MRARPPSLTMAVMMMAAIAMVFMVTIPQASAVMKASATEKSSDMMMTTATQMITATVTDAGYGAMVAPMTDDPAKALTKMGVSDTSVINDKTVFRRSSDSAFGITDQHYMTASITSSIARTAEANKLAEATVFKKEVREFSRAVMVNSASSWNMLLS